MWWLPGNDVVKNEAFPRQYEQKNTSCIILCHEGRRLSRLSRGHRKALHLLMQPFAHAREEVSIGQHLRRMAFMSRYLRRIAIIAAEC